MADNCIVADLPISTAAEAELFPNLSEIGFRE